MAVHNETGKAGESVAVQFLIQQGYKILAQNFKTKLGEIDIVAKDQGQVVFVEVKTRSGYSFGAPSEAIVYHKLLSLIKTGQYFLKVKSLGENFRIDAIEIVLRDGKVKVVNQIKNITF